MQQNYLANSILFADLVQKQFTNRVGRKNRGVKQAGYYVISYTMMPSVLIELGFISNNSEEDFLNSEKGQSYMASAIYRAFKDYKIKLEGVDVSKPKENAPKKKAEQPKKEPAPIDTPTPNPVVNPNTVTGLDINAEMPKVDADIDYRVQVATSTKLLELKSYNFKGFDAVSVTENHGKYKYYLGHFTNFNDALAFQRKLREEAFKDAFMVVFYKGEEISLKEAENILQENK